MTTRPCTLVFAAVVASHAASANQGRDAASGAANAVIRGTVIADEPTPAPLTRAIVTVTAAELPVPRSAITDEGGRFVVQNLPGGRFSIVATKHGYVATNYGARGIGRPGTPVVVAPGQIFDATLRMAPAAVLTGVIRDERGEPLSGLEVFAIDARQPVAPPPSTPSRGARLGAGVDTDDRGVYRIYDLVPGEYLVVALPTISVNAHIGRPTSTEVDRVLAFLAARSMTSAGVGVQMPTTTLTTAHVMSLAPVYYPGALSLTDAAHIKVGPGEVRDGIDFVVAAVPATTIDGLIVNMSGWSPASVALSIVGDSSLSFFGLAGSSPRLAHPPDAEGRFTYANVVPGRYKIVARATTTPDGSGGRGGSGFTAAGSPAGRTTAADTMYAVEEVEVIGPPVSGVALRLVRASTVSGRVVLDTATQSAPTNLTGIRVTIEPMDSPPSTVDETRIDSRFSAQQYAMLHIDGTFEFPGIAPAKYRIVCAVPAAAGSGWWLRSAMVGTRDVLDSSLDVTLGADVTNIVLTVTDRHSELAGTLQTPSGAPTADYFIVAMPAEASLRVPGSRRIVSTRPGTDGHFRFVDLPAGNYLLVALHDLLQTDLQRLEYLAELASAGVHVTLGQGERKIQDLRIER
jgi:hypothetical protein